MRTILEMRRRPVVALATIALLLPAAAACGAQEKHGEQAHGGTAEGGIGVVASTTQICDYVTQLASQSQDLSITRTGADGKTLTLGADPSEAATQISLTCLLAPNASAHEHEMTASQARALSQADLFLVSGVDLEHFLDDAVTSTGFSGRMVVTSGVYGASDIDDLPAQLDKEKDLPYSVDRGIETVDVAPWPFPPEDGESQPEFRYDPHVWTSPKNVKIQINNIGHALEEAAPASAKTIQEHVQVYESALDDLDSWIRESLDSVPAQQRVLFTSHDAFGYFARDYGVDFKGAALSDFNAQADATATKIQETVQAIKQSHAVAVFAENSMNPRAVEKVAELAGVRAIVGDDALYGDSLGEAGSDGETYIGSILHNVTNLTNAWGGTPASLPSSLSAWAPAHVDGH